MQYQVQHQKENPEEWQDGLYNTLTARFAEAKKEYRIANGLSLTSTDSKKRKARVPAVIYSE